MGGGKKPQTGTQNLDALAQLSQKIFGLSEPAMGAGMDMLTRAIQTGGVEARIPEYRQALEKSMQASSQAQAQMGEDLSRAGIMDTPFGQQILAQMVQQGAQQAAYIPTQMQTEDFWRVLSLMFPGATQALGTGAGAAGQAAGAEAQRYATEAQMANAQTQLFGQLFAAPFQMFATPRVSI